METQVVSAQSPGVEFDIEVARQAGIEYLKAIDNVRFAYAEEVFANGKLQGLSFDVEVAVSGEKYRIRKKGRPYLPGMVGPDFSGQVLEWAFDGDFYQHYNKVIGEVERSRSAEAENAAPQIVWRDGPLMQPLSLLHPGEKPVRSRRELLQHLSDSAYAVVPAAPNVRVRILQGGDLKRGGKSIGRREIRFPIIWRRGPWKVRMPRSPAGMECPSMPGKS